MTLDEVVLKLKEHPIYMKNGKGLLSKKFKCSQDTIVEAKRLVRGVKPTNTPKILIFDLETAPMSAYVWGRWNQNISLDATISEWFVLCWSAKWLCSEYVMSDKLTSEEAIKEDDSRIMKSLWTLVDQADIIIAHNARRADVKWMNTRFILNGMTPPKPYHIIDTLEIAKREFKFSSNKLDALAGYFGIEHKMNTSFDLWKGCISGDSEALNYMCEYNKKDVEILENVYLHLRPWIKNHPNVGNISECSDRCAYCNSSRISKIEDKFYFTSVGKYNLYRCNHCGGISKGRDNLNRKKVNLTSVLR
jgi:hypothetical protein